MKEFFQNLLDDFIDSPLETIMHLSLALFSSAAAVCIIIAAIRMLAEF